jgi:hypothetical protein
MKWPKSKNENPIKLIWSQDLERIRKLAPPPPREAIYPYLKAVYRRASRLGRIDEPTKKKFTKILSGFHPRIKPNRMRLIIELTALPHMKPKMKLKYTQVLRYARKRQVKSSGVVEFIKSEGGINKCVDKYKLSKSL